MCKLKKRQARDPFPSKVPRSFNGASKSKVLTQFGYMLVQNALILYWLTAIALHWENAVKCHPRRFVGIIYRYHAHGIMVTVLSGALESYR
jgi:hypothetical protein